MRIAAVILAGALLAACGAETGVQAEAEIAWTQDYASCGLEMQDRMAWGQGVSGSELEMQEVELEEQDLRLRVWSAGDAGLEVGADALTGRAAGPAWVAADVTRNRGYMAYLETGAAELRVESDTFSCAPAAQDQ